MSDIRTTLVPDVDAPKTARRTVLHATADLSEAIQGRAEAVVSEIVTETVLSCRWAEDIAVLTVSVGSAALRVEVYDHCPRFAQHGTGLMPKLVIEHLATRSGAERHGDLHVAWFEIDLAEAA
jgi:hypothetical protein